MALWRFGELPITHPTASPLQGETLDVPPHLATPLLQAEGQLCPPVGRSRGGRIGGNTPMTNDQSLITNH